LIWKVIQFGRIKIILLCQYRNTDYLYLMFLKSLNIWQNNDVCIQTMLVVCAQDLHNLLNRSGECVGIRSGFLSLHTEFEFLEESLHQNEIEENQYFYHTDHLGSSSWITDASGAVNQHLQYLPPDSYRDGEDFVYQRNSSWNVPYTFSGKEKDSETGYSYFGARYYDSDLCIWLSVDPLADNSPSMSCYMYTAGNPVMLIDPDGRDWFENELTGDVYYNSDMRKGQEGTGAMTGEGWQHMGENGMFMKDKDDVQNSDHFVLFRNGAGLAEGETGDASYTNHANGTVTLESSFKGEKAKKFMSNCGYDFKPSETVNKIYHEIAVNQILPGGGSVFVENLYGVSIVTKNRYAKKDAIPVFSKDLIKRVQESGSNWTEYSISQISYRTPSSFRSIVELIFAINDARNGDSKGGLNHVEFINGWNNYKGNDQILLNLKKQ